MLIPMIGFVPGIIAMRKGIACKDKILSFIGLSGILISIAFYSILIYYGTHSRAAKEHEVMITQYQLNLAIQEIEFFRLTSGYYPDSLQQVYSVDKYAPIIDPSSQRWLYRKYSYFNYKKIGDNNYTLFSSGRDLTPNTSDDIYPDKSHFGSNKTGFLREPK